MVQSYVKKIFSFSANVLANRRLKRCAWFPSYGSQSRPESLRAVSKLRAPDELLAEGKRLRQEHWKIQKDAGVDIIPSNDFSFYDQVLDHIQLFGVSHVRSNGRVQ